MSEKTLHEDMIELVGRYGRDAVIDTALGLRRRPLVDATPDEKAQLARMMDRLVRYPDKVFNPFAFLQKQKAAGIPVKVTIEILERVVAVKPDEPWALIETIMRDDYPGFPWGTRTGGFRKVDPP
ncbi:MAG: hypothetical protein ACE5HU_06305, partial [Acidobacteriota bacterium]